MTLPVAASIRIAKGFKQTIFLSIIFGEDICTWGAVNSLIILNLAPGGTIVMIAVLILLVTILFKKVYSKDTSKLTR